MLSKIQRPAESVSPFQLVGASGLRPRSLPTSCFAGIEGCEITTAHPVLGCADFDLRFAHLGLGCRQDLLSLLSQPPRSPLELLNLQPRSKQGNLKPSSTARRRVLRRDADRRSRCCHCVPVRRAAPGETLACIGGAYAVAPGRALAVAMGCYRLGVLAGIRRSRLAALAYGGLLYYPTPRQSALPLMRYLHQLRVGRSYLPVGLDRLES